MFRILILLLFTFTSLLARKPELTDNRTLRFGELRFLANNRGSYGIDLATLKGSFNWPDTTKNNYFAGAGFMFGGIKNGDTLLESSYWFASGSSDFAPGSLVNGQSVDSVDKRKYQLYYSNDYHKGSGFPNEPDYSWPLWLDDTGFFNDKLGYYVDDTDMRNNEIYTEGPAFAADIVTYSNIMDGDLSYFEEYRNLLEKMGYPIGIDIQVNCYWIETESSGESFILRYLIINKSNEQLLDCIFSPLYEPNIATEEYPFNGFENDISNISSHDYPLVDSYSFVYTEPGNYEKQEPFGYLGASTIYSPGIDEAGFVRDANRFYQKEQRLVAKTVKRIITSDDLLDRKAIYKLLKSDDAREGNVRGKQWIAHPSGVFNMNPGDTAEFIMLIAVSPSIDGKVATGLKEDRGFLETLLEESGRYYFRDILVSTETNVADRVIIYPNPAEYFIYLEGIEPFNKVEIIDFLGNVIIELHNPAGIKSRIILPSDLNTGMYFVRISGMNYIHIEKVLIIR